jgi:hypothetical protein
VAGVTTAARAGLRRRGCRHHSRKSTKFRAIVMTTEEGCPGRREPLSRLSSCQDPLSWMSWALWALWALWAFWALWALWLSPPRHDSHDSGLPPCL